MNRIAILSFVFGAVMALAQPCLGISFQFEETGSLAMTCEGGQAVLLPSGQVLVAGGSTGSTYIADAELYHAASGTWSTTGSLLVPTGFHYRDIVT